VPFLRRPLRQRRRYFGRSFYQRNGAWNFRVVWAGVPTVASAFGETPLACEIAERAALLYRAGALLRTPRAPPPPARTPLPLRLRPTGYSPARSRSPRQQVSVQPFESESAKQEQHGSLTKEGGRFRKNADQPELGIKADPPEKTGFFSRGSVADRPWTWPGVRKRRENGQKHCHSGRLQRLFG